MGCFLKIIADTNIPYVKECFSSLGEVVLAEGREISADLVRDADVVLVRSVTKVNRELLETNSVKFVGTTTIGVDHIDHDYLESRGIGFASAPGSNANSVAEYVAAAILEVGAKKAIELEGASIGIIGVGNVGSRVESKARALGMEVVLNDPPLKRQTGEAKYRGIEEVYRCDFVTMHVPLTYEGIDKTYHMAGGEFFSKLKRGNVFINSSRGGVVETGCLKEAIGAGGLAGCVLDVWEDEPGIDEGLLRTVDIGTAHIAGYSFDGKVGGMMMIYDSVCDYFGLAKKFTAESFLPPAEVEVLELECGGKSDEMILREAVGGVYDIMADDAGLRSVIGTEEQNRCAIFDGFRKNYRVRREFGNMEIILKGGSDSLREKLAGLGFRVRR